MRKLTFLGIILNIASLAVAVLIPAKHVDAGDIRDQRGELVNSTGPSPLHLTCKPVSQDFMCNVTAISGTTGGVPNSVSQNTTLMDW